MSSSASQGSGAPSASPLERQASLDDWSGIWLSSILSSSQFVAVLGEMLALLRTSRAMPCRFRQCQRRSSARPRKTLRRFDCSLRTTRRSWVKSLIKRACVCVGDAVWDTCRSVFLSVSRLQVLCALSLDEMNIGPEIQLAWGLTHGNQIVVSIEFPEFYVTSRDVSRSACIVM